MPPELPRDACRAPRPYALRKARIPRSPRPPGFLSRLFDRREAERFQPRAKHSPRSSARTRWLAGPADGRRPTGATAGAARPRPRLRTSRQPPSEPWYRRITWKRVVLGVLLFIVFWIALSFVLFMISAHQQSSKVSDATRPRSTTPGNLLTSPNNVLVLGSDRRPGEKAAAARTRSC